MLPKIDHDTMKYKKWYDDLMRTRQLRKKEDGQLYEKHHIIPRSLGGTNDQSNLVYLTPREHFLAHWLLIKFTFDNDKKKMLYALHRMTHKGYTYRIVSGWQYEIARKASSDAMKGNDKWKFRKKKSHGPHSEQTKAKMRGPRGPQKNPNPNRRNQNGANNHMYGRIGPLHHNYGKRQETDLKNRKNGGT